MAQNHILLETIQLSQSAASVTFDNIPQTGYTDLKIVVSARADAVDGGSASWMSTLIRVNGATTGTHRFLYGDGSTAASSSNTSNIWTYTVGSNATANTFGNFELYLPNYASTTQNKSYSVDTVTENNATLSGIWLHAGLVSNNAAVTSLGFATNTGNFVAGSTFSIYGIAALGTTPVTAPFATGGNRVENDGTYWIHTFLSSGTFKPFKTLDCEYLVVAGGGAGGDSAGGGGGAGGFRTSLGTSGRGASAEANLLLDANTNYNVQIGAGGARAIGGANTNGVNSVFSSITSLGGGAGGYGGGVSPSGGSGGGASAGGGSTPAISGGAGTTGQGYDGGNTNNLQYNYVMSAGGGGAGAVGGNGSGTYNPGFGGNGGAGQVSSISGTSTYYAGGGGGCQRDPDGGSAAGTGGIGGGGAGGFITTINPVSGTASTGGGGGGGATGTTTTLAGNGGSGIVIVRYPMSS
jgi:hypothetical protein